MKIKDKLKLTDLYFGCKLYEMSYSSREERKIVTYNLFDSSRVLRSVAMWVLMSEDEKKKHDALSWCFGETRGRCGYEFIVCPWPYGDDDTIDDCGVKVDTFEMYVKPNKELLLDLVSRVTKNSAKEYLREERKRYRR